MRGAGESRLEGAKSHWRQSVRSLSMTLRQFRPLAVEFVCKLYKNTVIFLFEMPAPVTAPTMPAPHSPNAHKGRGAVGNPAHRFASTHSEAVDDGWQPVTWTAGQGALAPDAQAGSGLEDDMLLAQAEANADWDAWATGADARTEVIPELAKSAITKNQSPDVPFDRSLNPYRGCEHGCIYCFARPTHSYLGWSPGLDFERKIVAKTNLAHVLAKELDKPQYRPAPVAIGAVTDAYQPVERKLKLTRQVLEVLVARRHPFSIITKSAGVERDLDLIAPMARAGLASVYITITSLDGELCRRMEPRAASPARRLRTVATLSAAGVPVGVSLAPQIPFLNEDMEQVLQAAREAGATRAFYSVLRLPWELGELFEDWLKAHYPDRAARVMARIHDMRGGKANDPRFGQRMRGDGLWAQLLAQRFARSCAQLGFNVRDFHGQAAEAAPKPAGNGSATPRQASLF